MSGAENIKIMKQFYSEFMNGNMPGILDLVTDDFVMSNDFTPNVATAGEYTGLAVR